MWLAPEMIHAQSITQSSLPLATHMLYKQLKHISVSHNATIKTGPETESPALYCTWSWGTEGTVEGMERTKGKRRK